MGVIAGLEIVIILALATGLVIALGEIYADIRNGILRTRKKRKPNKTRFNRHNVNKFR